MLKFAERYNDKRNLHDAYKLIGIKRGSHVENRGALDHDHSNPTNGHLLKSTTEPIGPMSPYVAKTIDPKGRNTD